MGAAYLRTLSKYPFCTFLELQLMIILAGQMDGEGSLMVRLRWAGRLPIGS